MKRPCIVCGDQVSKGRWNDGGKHYCMKAECIAQQSTFALEYRLVLMPKQGMAWVHVSDPFLRTGGKSSGRTN